VILLLLVKNSKIFKISSLVRALRNIPEGNLLGNGDIQRFFRRQMVFLSKEKLGKKFF